MAYIEMKHSYKRYQVGDTKIVANRDVNFEIEKGELVIILQRDRKSACRERV